jgi:hypothetical protein
VEKMTHLDEIERQIHFIGNLCEIEPDAIKDMDIADWLGVQELVGEMSQFKDPTK